MKTKSKNYWLGVGAFVVVGAAGAGMADPLAGSIAKALPTGPAAGTAIARVPGSFHLAQHAEQAKDKEAGEGGESQAIANLPPDLAFAVRIALLRGHLLVGDELVKQQQWNAALPHFLHPTEELYADLKDKLEEYKVAPFDAALKALANVVKAKKSADYAKAQKSVNDALAAVDAAMKDRTGDWTGLVVEAAVETLKTATGEYKQAIVANKIAKPVEYQDARGFILHSERMIESVASDLEKKDAAALAAVRAGLAELKKAFPTAMPPKAPVKDYSRVLADVARVELAAAKLM